MTDDRVIATGLTGLVLMIQFVRWFTERDVVTKKDIAAQQKQIDALETNVKTRVHVNDQAALQRQVDDLAQALTGKADVDAAISEADLLKRLEKERQEMRGETNEQIGRCVSLDRYIPEHRAITENLNRLNKKVFNGDRGSGVST